MIGILGPMQDTRPNKYLGLPPIIGRSKREVFAEVKERVGKKLAGWKEKNALYWRKGGSDKGCGLDSSHVYYELFPSSKKAL